MKLNKAKITGMALGLATAVTGVTMLVPQAAQATYADGLVYQLATMATAFGFNSRNITHNPTIDALRHGGKHMISLNLRSGATYGLMGVCDSDCGDIDLKLYDQNYRLIDNDMSSDDTPVVTVTPRWTGTFYLEVDMESCRANYCYYGVGVFGK